MKLPNKDVVKLEEAYLSIYKLNESMPEESPEGAAIFNAMMAGPEKKAKAKADIVGKQVTVYKREREQQYADKTDLTKADKKDGQSVLHSQSVVTGATPICSGVVQDVLWQTQHSDIQLVLDTMEGEQTIPLTFRNFITVVKGEDPASVFKRRGVPRTPGMR
jgi:hypothetical protein